MELETLRDSTLLTRSRMKLESVRMRIAVRIECSDDCRDSQAHYAMASISTHSEQCRPATTKHITVPQSQRSASVASPAHRPPLQIHTRAPYFWRLHLGLLAIWHRDQSAALAFALMISRIFSNWATLSCSAKTISLPAIAIFFCSSSETLQRHA